MLEDGGLEVTSLDHVVFKIAGPAATPAHFTDGQLAQMGRCLECANHPGVCPHCLADMMSHVRREERRTVRRHCHALLCLLVGGCRCNCNGCCALGGETAEELKELKKECADLAEARDRAHETGDSGGKILLARIAELEHELESEKRRHDHTKRASTDTIAEQKKEIHSLRKDNAAMGYVVSNEQKNAITASVTTAILAERKYIAEKLAYVCGPWWKWMKQRIEMGKAAGERDADDQNAVEP